MSYFYIGKESHTMKSKQSNETKRQNNLKKTAIIDRESYYKYMQIFSH